MRQTVGTEKRNFLASGNGVHAVNCGYSCLDHFLRVDSLEGIDGLSLNIEELLCKHRGTFIDGHTRTVECPPKHLLGDGHLEHLSSELTVCVEVIDTTCTFKDLDNSSFPGDFEHLAFPYRTITQADIDNLGIPREFHVVENDQRAIDFNNRPVIDFGSYVVIP